MRLILVLIGLLFFSIVTADRARSTRVDLVEINHCYNRDTGDRRFVQIIYWDRQDTACLHVRHWHMADKLKTTFRRGNNWVIVRSTDDGVPSEVVSPKLRVTHTYNDPEEDDRDVFPLEARRQLEK